MLEAAPSFSGEQLSERLKRLGLYTTGQAKGALTPAGLAATAGIAERYAREWLEQQAVAGLLAVDDAVGPAAERRDPWSTRPSASSRRTAPAAGSPARRPARPSSARCARDAGFARCEVLAIDTPLFRLYRLRA
ncbi:MAG TPA: hypothetical protein VFV05_20735 [Methylomirabilota bacterium]|nr:hypothetical protein [Methylomirabilota bacterium]